MIPASWKPGLFRIGPQLVSKLSSTIVTRLDSTPNTTKAATQAMTQKMVYLTFDDGPSDATPLLLDLLDELGIGATFFLTGRSIRSSISTVLRMSENHVIGNHFYHHRDPWLMRPKTLLESVAMTDAEIARITGSFPELIRPPYGHVSHTLISHAKKAHRHIVLWDVMPGDFLPDVLSDDIALRTIQMVTPGSVVTLHDSGLDHFNSILEPAILDIHAKLAHQGYIFSSIDL